MCLAVPAKVLKIDGSTAELSVEGNTVVADISMVPQVQIGDYVIVHAGYAIQIYDEHEALETLKTLRELGEFNEGEGAR